MFAAVRNGLIIVFLVVGVYFVANFAEPTKNQLLMMVGLAETDVQGASTERAEEISGKIGSDIGEHVEDTKNQAVNLRIADVITTISRVQKIPHDFQNIGEYVKEQVDNVLKSREQKEVKETKE